jgi:hypothetical protein
MNNNSDYITEMVKSSGKKTTERKVWSIGLESTLVPFFVATNATGRTSINRDAIGSPLRLAYNEDGSVKFSKTGKPIIRVAKPISDQVKVMRDNFIAGLQSFVHTVKTENAELYNAEAIACRVAGKPIADKDQANIDKIMLAIEAEAKAKAESEAQLVKDAIDHAEQVEQTELIPA